MMGPTNPYGPSGPPPPGLSAQHPPHGMPPGMGMRQNPMYPSGGPPNAPHGSLPPSQGGMPPKHMGSRSVMTTTQLQQLSAQVKAYKMLARNNPLPEALMCIVQGRKPTQAMLASLGKGQPQQSQSGGGAWSGGSGSPHGGGTASPNPSPGPPASSAGGGGGGGSINLYPPSPSLSQSQGASPKTPQQPSTMSSSLMRSTSATSLASVSAAPNVTISSSGELPLPVRQAISAAQSGSTGTPASTAAASQPSVTVATKTTTSSSALSASTAATPSGKAALKPVKLAPPGKPLGVDPMVIMKEREHR